MSPPVFFWLLLKASLFSTGGMGNLPSLHHDLLARGWATERQFAESLAVGQVAPGPNGLWVMSLGYFVDGLRGALLALLAITLPPFLVLAVDRLYRHMKDHPAIEGFVSGLGLAVVGISVVVLVGLLRSVGPDVRSVSIALASLVLGGRVPVVVVLALAGLVGIALG
ncbi:MAG TPA: chromate transporter [Chthonomonadales bacterium]|nr:chromate transporter [Chthonomonadales bacterium]